MTVAELIETLKAMPQDATVISQLAGTPNKMGKVRRVDVGRFAPEGDGSYRFAPNLGTETVVTIDAWTERA